MGALRASNGHPQPYNVRYWGVGNEVYGSYQIGYTDAVTYARGLIEMARAMRERDPSIRIVGVGLGVHNDYRRQKRDWNRTVLEIAGGSIDLLDAHYYVYGPDARLIAREAAEPVRRAMLGASARVAAYYGDLRKLLESRPGIGVVHYEWACCRAHRPPWAFRGNRFSMRSAPPSNITPSFATATWCAAPCCTTSATT